MAKCPNCNYNMKNEYNKTDPKNIELWGYWCPKCNTFVNRATGVIE